MEERTQQLATHSPALCVPLFTLTLVTDFRYSWLTYRFQRTHWHHELVSRRSPNLTEKGLHILKLPIAIKSILEDTGPIPCHQHRQAPRHSEHLDFSYGFGYSATKK